MSIKKVKLTMSRVGVHSLNAKTVLYMPMVTIDYNESDKKKQSVYLDVDNRLVEKNYFKGMIVCHSFFAGITEDQYLIYDEDGKRTGTTSIKEVGELIQVNEDSFICLKDKLASWIDVNGSLIKSRDLTDGELKMLGR